MQGRVAHVAMVGLVAGALAAGCRIHHGVRRHHFYVELDHARGLQPGDQLYLRGVVVGTVASVDVSSESRKVRVRVVPRREHRTTLMTNALFVITNDRSVIGRKCVVAAIVDADGAPIENGTVVRGYSSYTTFLAELVRRKLDGHDLADQIKALRDTAGETARDFRRLLKELAAP